MPVGSPSKVNLSALAVLVQQCFSCSRCCAPQRRRHHSTWHGYWPRHLHAGTGCQHGCRRRRPSLCPLSVTRPCGQFGSTSRKTLYRRSALFALPGWSPARPCQGCTGSLLHLPSTCWGLAYTSGLSDPAWSDSHWLNPNRKGGLGCSRVALLMKKCVCLAIRRLLFYVGHFMFASPPLFRLLFELACMFSDGHCLGAGTLPSGRGSSPRQCCCFFRVAILPMHSLLRVATHWSPTVAAHCFENISHLVTLPNVPLSICWVAIVLGIFD